MWRHLAFIIDQEKAQYMLGGLATKRKRVEGSLAQLVDECVGLINFENQNPLMTPDTGVGGTEHHHGARSGLVEGRAGVGDLLVGRDGDPQKVQPREPPQLEQLGEHDTEQALEKNAAMPPMREERKDERQRDVVGKEMEFHHHKKKKKALDDAVAMQAADFEFGPMSILRTAEPGEEKVGKKRDFRRTAYMAPPQAVLMSSSCARRLR